MLKTYVLDEAGEPVPEPDILKWAQGLQNADKQLARTPLPGGIVVSTIFLGLDHSFSGARLLWETMIFSDDYDDWARRYPSRIAALAGHEAAVEAALAQQPKGD